MARAVTVSDARATRLRTNERMKDREGIDWISRSDRRRKKIEITLSDEARAKLERLAGPGMRSAWIEQLILGAPDS